MSGTPIEMSKVKHVIRMYESGMPQKEIARRLGISKNTVKDYIKKAEESNLLPPELLAICDSPSFSTPSNISTWILMTVLAFLPELESGMWVSLLKITIKMWAFQMWTLE